MSARSDVKKPPSGSPNKVHYEEDPDDVIWHPDDEAEHLAETRERVKSKHGFSDAILDKLYGPRGK